jgi:hypothetical protein
MSVDVTPAKTSLEFGVPKPLFDVSITGGPLMLTMVNRWDMTRDGRKFLFNSPTGEAGGTTPINIVLNWPNLLKTK